MEEERKARTEEQVIVDDDFSWEGFQVVRREFFSHVFEPSVRINGNSIMFNAACLRKLPNATHIQVLINQETKTLAVKEAEPSEDNFRWCMVDAKTGKHKTREGKGFIVPKTFDIMGWNPNYRYKVLGSVISVKGETIIIFRLEDAETYLPIETNPDGTTKKMGRKPHYPAAWKDSFGLPIEEHRSHVKIDVLDGFVRYEFVKPKAPSIINTPKPLEGEQPTQGQINMFDGGENSDRRT